MLQLEQFYSILLLYTPIILIWWANKTHSFKKREWVALCFSACWLTSSLIFLTEIGESLGFWKFHCSLIEKLVIMSIWITWWLAISLLPILFYKRGYRYYHSICLALLAYLLDLWIMPFLSNWITLYAHWQWADFIVCMCLYTSLQITNTTVHSSAFYKRNLFLGITLIIATFWTPGARLFNNALFIKDLDWLSLPTLGLILGFGLAHQAALDFAEQGKGTPFPLDPPQHLVTSGAYALIKNPMQTGFLIATTSWAILLGQWTLMLLPISLFIYAVGFCNRHEKADLEQRFGNAYSEYNQRVKNWFPR